MGAFIWGLPKNRNKSLLPALASLRALWRSDGIFCHCGERLKGVTKQSLQNRLLRRFAPRNDGYKQPRDDGYKRPCDDGYKQPRNDGYKRPRDDGYKRPRDDGMSPGSWGKLQVNDPRIGFTLVEMLTVTAVLAVMIGFVYLVIVTNWSAYQDRIIRADLGHELNKIMAFISMDVRKASGIIVSKNDDDSQSVYIYDQESGLIGRYDITSDGRLTLRRGETGQTDILSEKVNPAVSSFDQDGDALKVRLVLEEQLFRRKIHVESSTEIYARN